MANVSSSNGLEKYPKLRFPGFGEPIQAKKLSRYLIENTDRNKALKYDKSDVLSVSGEFGIVNQIAFQGRSFAGESVAEYHIVDTKSPLKANPYGIIKVNNGNPGIVSTLYAVYHPIDVIPQYIDYYFCNDLRLNKYLKPLVNIGAKHDMKVNNAAVLFGDVYFPNATEQSKIVEFLQILDYRIKKQRALVESLKKYKRGTFDAVFSQKIRLIPKPQQREWRSYKLSDFASRITRKNGVQSDIPLTISAQYGLIDQRDFFSKTVASADMSNYYLLHKGEYAYNRSTSSDYPFGSVKRLELYPMGAVSTLYLCFTVNNDIILSDLIKWYFESSKWHRTVQEICAEGARNHGLLNVPTNGFFNTIHMLPSDPVEQMAIARYLELIQYKYDVALQELDMLMFLKNGFLQQLFI